MRRIQTRKTKGLNAEVIVAPAVAFTTDNTYEDFVANSVVGEIGCFLEGGALNADAIAAGEKFFIAQKLSTGVVKKTTLINFDDMAVVKKAYTAPVKQVSYLGFAGSGGSLNIGAVAANQVYSFILMDTTTAVIPLPASGFDYATKTGDTAYEVMSALAKQVNNINGMTNDREESVASAQVVTNGSYGNWVMTGTTPTITFTHGSTLVTLGGGTPTIDAAAGEFLAFNPTTTPDATNSDVYKVASISAGVSITLDRPFEGATQTLTEAEGEGTRLKQVTTATEYGIRLTSRNFEETFSIAVQETIEDADITYATAPTFGQGTSDDIAELEREGEEFAGHTTKNAENASYYGAPASQVVSGETYDQWILSVTSRQRSSAPLSDAAFPVNVVIAAANGAAPATELDTLFGT